MKKKIGLEEARLKMATLCSRSERCKREIAEKLRKMELPTAGIQEIVDFLEEAKFIDENRYARSFANDKVRFSGWGRNKIRQALALNRIPSDIIREAMQDIDENDYADALHRAAIAKARSLDPEDRDDRLKLYRHLASRGFESELITHEIAAIRREAREASSEEDN